MSATVIALGLFNRWLWKLSLLQGWFVKRPILAGDWSFTIRSLWTDPETDCRPDPIVAKVNIRQTYARLHLSLATPESSGNFVASRIVAKDDGTYQVAGVYRNEPKLGLQEHSRPHLGALLLDVIGEPSSPSEFKGNYWTDRGTRGENHGVRSQ